MSNSIPGARRPGALRADALPFPLGVAAGGNAPNGAGQDQLGRP